ncbi:tyrosine-type recombinase/integrase [Pedobacter sp. SD-b]|uniref:Tyrosine recombinase XerC n=1 Tax=Pedobacter segetis TaxID=2793069 RepID=A0ABS1BIM6_9SPHI|nr:tyrosine-type recombinase/integrase [Pedobacter segetis]MBK0382688.1 tyrosine-type recombinase/integrase [Pedobacter segetis]
MVLERFYNYLQYEKRYSKHTLIAYKTDLQQYSQHLTSLETDILQANHHFIRAWMVSLMDDEMDSRSVNRKLSALRSLYKFLLKESLIEENPIIKITAPKVAKKLPTFINEDKIAQLLDADFFEGSFAGNRDKLVIEMLFGTGIRLSELIGLKVKDYLPKEKTIKVLGKRNKERIIPIHLSLSNLLDQYLALKAEQVFSGNNETLIVTNTGSAVYSKFIYRLVQKYLTYVSTQSKRSPHVLRHSFATALLNKGADINAIKDLLGHSNLAATQVYTHNSIERLKSIYKQAHPKA